MLDADTSHLGLVVQRLDVKTIDHIRHQVEMVVLGRELPRALVEEDGDWYDAN